MNKHTPSKEMVRDWLKREVAQHRPPPDPKQIRRELGWDLLEAQRINRGSCSSGDGTVPRIGLVRI
jgi:hypothetical protein